MRKLQSQAPYQRARLKKERADHKKKEGLMFTRPSFH